MAKKRAKHSVKNLPKERPVGVTILGVLGYIGAVFTLLLGIAAIAGSAYLASLITKLSSLVPASAGVNSVIPTVGAMGFVMLGIVIILFGVLDYFIARGLMNGKNWARILLLVFAVLGVIGSIWPFRIGGLVIDGLIIWYLGFYKPAVAYFK